MKPTRGDDSTFTPPGLQDATEPATRESRPSVSELPGYHLGEVIRRGGMGEVVVAYDENMEREVALKRMRGPKPSEDAVNRFMREAKVQARLDHPAMVPVHESCWFI